MKWQKIKNQPQCSSVGADSISAAHTLRGAPSWGSLWGQGLATASELQHRVSMSDLSLDEDAEHYADTNDYETTIKTSSLGEDSWCYEQLLLSS